MNNVENHTYLILEALRVIHGTLLTIEGHKLGFISDENYLQWYIQTKALYEDFGAKITTSGQQRIENADGG